jgi:hypothetical protein
VAAGRLTLDGHLRPAVSQDAGYLCCLNHTFT